MPTTRSSTTPGHASTPPPPRRRTGGRSPGSTGSSARTGTTTSAGGWRAPGPGRARARRRRRSRSRPSEWRAATTKTEDRMGVLDDKVAIVTGSARGIGRATAELLSEHGAKVLINDLDGDVAEQAAGEIAGETAVFSGDLTKGDAPEKLVQTAIDSFGQIDIIVNN